MPDQTPFPIPDASLFLRPRDAKPSPLDDWLAKTLKEGPGQDELGPNSFDVYRYLRRQAAQGPTKEDVNAGQAGIDASAAQDLLARMQGIPVPQRQPMSYPNVSALNLPNVPQRQPGHAEPISSIAAGLLGLVSPTNAGEFGAAALHGALKGQQQQYEDVQQKYQQDFQQSVAKHADEMRRENARAEIENENKVIGYENSVAKTKSDKEMALEANNASRLQGMSTFLQGIADKVRGPRQAQSQADDVLLQYEEEQKVKARKEKNFLSAAEISERMKDRALSREQMEAQKNLSRAETIWQHNEQKRHNLEVEKMGIIRPGYTLGPNGSIVPAPQSNLPVKTQAEIDNLRARTSATGRKGDVAGVGWANLEYRKQHQIAEDAANELKKMHAYVSPGSGSKDPVIQAKVKALWDKRYAALEAMQAIDTSPRLPKNQRQGGGQLSPAEAMKLPSGTHFTGTDGKEYVRP